MDFNSFLLREYVNLWKEHGLDMEQDLENRLSAMKPSQTRRTSQDENSLESIRHWIGECRRCGLCERRNSIVFGVGDPKAKLMFVGEGPGAEEDTQGLPFVGRAGQLLTKIIQAMGYTRDKVYIANIVKCRPPNNRAPEPNEISSCSPFLRAQIDVIKPRGIVALGLCSAHTLTGLSTPISSLRGKFHKLCWNPNIWIMPTYHPAYLLRNPNAKKMVWDDMKLVQTKMGAA